MNANLTISEILTIAVVILIVFGPHRLPEMARRAGEMLAKVRQAASSVRDEFSREMEDFKEVAAPLSDIDKELKQAKADIQKSLPKVDDLPGTTDVQRVVNPVPDIPPTPAVSEADVAAARALAHEAEAAEEAAAEARARADAAAAVLYEGGEPAAAAEESGDEELGEVGGAA